MPLEYTSSFLPDDGDLAAQALFRNVLGGGGTLVGVHEAHLEHVVLTLGGSGGGSGGGQGEDAVGIGLSGSGLAGLGGHGAQGDLHAPVLENVVGVDGLLGVVLVILIAQVELDRAAFGVDLVHGDLGAAVGCVAVDSSAAGQGAGAAQLEGGAFGGSFGSGVVGGIAGGVAVDSSWPPQAARPSTMAMASIRLRNFFFIVSLSFLLKE